MTTFQPRRDLLAAFGGIAAIAGITAVLRGSQEHPHPTIAALLFLLVVLVAATAARLRVSIGLSVTAMLAFNFFLLPPFHTFAIADPENWVALIVFVVVAIIASELSNAARHRAAAAEALLTERTKAESLSQRADLASALLASFSHDLRTPLTAVRVAVTNLQDVSLPVDERRAQATLALEELERLTRLFDDILDMARIDAAAVAPKRQWVSAADVVDAAAAYIGPALAGHALQVDADEESEMHVDPRLTSTAIAHVLENAARYSPGGSSIAVRGWTDAEGGHFIVRDQGPGLDASDLAQLFEPFYRGRRTRHATGTGLGLAISRGLLVAEGGRITCENVADGGAQFTIVVPSAVRSATTQAL